MKKLSLTEWASIAEIAAAFVVTLSVVYVGLELNQNTNAIQQSSYQSTLDTLTNGDILLASNAELNTIVTNAEKDPTQLNEEEWSRFSRYALPRIGAWEYMFLSKQTNAISDSHWRGFQPYFEHLACDTGYRVFFEQNTFAYNPEFVTFVEKVIAACPQQKNQ